MARTPSSNYQADADTIFQWATADGDFFDRELDLSFLARALERHDHSSNRGLAVTRVGTGSIGTAAFATGSVDTAALGALQVTTSKLAALAVDNSKLAVGAAVANLGFTPFNKAGDTLSGPSSIAATMTFNNTVAMQHKDIGGTARSTIFADVVNQLWYGNSVFSLVLTGSALNWWNGAALKKIMHEDNDGAGSGFDSDLLDGQQGSFYQARANHTGTQAAATISPQGAGSGLDADTLDGVQGAGYAVVAASVPLGAVVWFRTLAELTAAGASWTRETNLDGRIPVGAGTTFTQTFVEATSYGANWTPSSGLSVGAIAALADGQVILINAATNTNVATATHTHPAPTLSGTGTLWLPPMRAGIFGRRI